MATEKSVALTKEQREKVRAAKEAMLTGVRSEMLKLIKTAGALVHRSGHADGIWYIEYLGDERVKLDGYAAEAYSTGNWDWGTEYIVKLEDLVFDDVSLLASAAADKLARKQVLGS